MPENEIAIPYTEVRRLVKATSNKSRLAKLQADIDNGAIGMIYAYRKGSECFIIKRYNTCRFIKKVW